MIMISVLAIVMQIPKSDTDKILNLQSAMEPDVLVRAVTVAESDIKDKIQVHGENNLDVAGAMTKLGMLYLWSSRYDDAERLSRRGLSILEKISSSDQNLYGKHLTILGYTMLEKKKFVEAEAAARKALLIINKNAGESSIELLESLSLLAASLMPQRKLEEAEIVLTKILSICDKSHLPDNIAMIIPLKNLIKIYYARSYAVMVGRPCCANWLGGP
jgi:tetratricopeptide (TPR) repeat protein